MDGLEDIETFVEVEAHGQRWGHRWTATATIHAEVEPLGAWRIERRYHALPGDSNEYHPRDEELKIETGGLHLNTESQYHGTAEWRDLPVPVDETEGGTLLDWIEAHCEDDLDQVLAEFISRLAVCDECGRPANRHTGLDIRVRPDHDGNPMLCDDCATEDG